VRFSFGADEHCHLPWLLSIIATEAVEEILAVGRAGRGLGMILHREGRLVGAAQALGGAVEQRDVRHLDRSWAAIGQTRKSRGSAR